MDKTNRTKRITPLMLLPMIFLAVVATGCDVLTGEQQYGEEFRLPVGNRALVSNDALIRFVEVVGESRCPTGAVCVWEGDAEVLLELKRTGFEPKRFTLHTNESMTNDTVVDGVSVRMLRLDPYPVVGEKSDPKAYVATLLLDR